MLPSLLHVLPHAEPVMSFVTRCTLAAALAWLPMLTDGDDAPVKPRPVIGVTTSVPGATLAAQLGLAEGDGLVIDEILPGMPAEAAGMAVHDIIVAIDGVEPVTSETLRDAVLAHHEQGGTLAVQVLRAGERQALSVGVATRTVVDGPAAGYWSQLAASEAVKEELAYARLLERSQLERLSAEKLALAKRAHELERAQGEPLDGRRAAELLAREAEQLERAAVVDGLRQKAEQQAQQLKEAARSRPEEIEEAKLLMAKLKAELAHQRAALEIQEAEQARRLVELDERMVEASRQADLAAVYRDTLDKAASEAQPWRGGMAIVSGDDGPKQLLYSRLAEAARGSGAGVGPQADLGPRLAAIEKRLEHIESLMHDLVESVR